MFGSLKSSLSPVKTVHVKLTGSSEEITALVREAAQSEVWAMDRPLVLRKLVK